MQVESLSSHGLYDNSFSNDSETLRSPIFHNLMFMCIMILQFEVQTPGEEGVGSGGGG